MSDLVHDRVLDAVAAVFNVDRTTITQSSTLDSLPTYSSFKIMEVVDRVERELTVEVDPDDLVPANLLRLDALCRTFRGAQRKEVYP